MIVFLIEYVIVVGRIQTEGMSEMIKKPCIIAETSRGSITYQEGSHLEVRVIPTTKSAYVLQKMKLCLPDTFDTWRHPVGLEKAFVAEISNDFSLTRPLSQPSSTLIRTVREGLKALGVHELKDVKINTDAPNWAKELAG